MPQSVGCLSPTQRAGRLEVRLLTVFFFFLMHYLPSQVVKAEKCQLCVPFKMGWSICLAFQVRILICIHALDFFGCSRDRTNSTSLLGSYQSKSRRSTFALTHSEHIEGFSIKVINSWNLNFYYTSRRLSFTRAGAGLAGVHRRFLKIVADIVVTRTLWVRVLIACNVFGFVCWLLLTSFYSFFDAESAFGGSCSTSCAITDWLVRIFVEPGFRSMMSSARIWCVDDLLMPGVMVLQVTSHKSLLTRCWSATGKTARGQRGLQRVDKTIPIFPVVCQCSYWIGLAYGLPLWWLHVSSFFFYSCFAH